MEHNELSVRKQWAPYNQPPAKPILYSTDFKRHIPLVHENIPLDVLRSKIKEFTIVLDSNDRDVIQYPNPFHYKVIIGPQIQQKISEYIKDIHGNLVRDAITNNYLTKEIVVPLPGPIIKDKIVWIKYIRLAYAVLPRAYTMDINSLKKGNNECCIDNKSNLLDGDISTQIHIRELSDQISPYKYSTNDSLSNSFAVLFDHTIINNYFFISEHEGAGIEYDESLSELSTLTVSIKDSRGKQLEYPFLKSCKCCNEGRCDNKCCSLKVLDMTTFFGSLALDFESVINEIVKINCIIDTKDRTIIGNSIDFHYEIKNNMSELKIKINGKYKNETYNIVADIRKTEDNTYNGSFKGTINGDIKVIIQGNHVNGVVEYNFGISKVVIPFSIPITISDSFILIQHDVNVFIYSKSLLENIKIEYPVNDNFNDIRLNIMIGNALKFVGKIEKNKLDGVLTGNIWNKYINLTIYVINGVGSVVGKYGVDDVSLIIQFDNVNGILNISGKVGNDVISYTYNSSVKPITFHNWMQLYGFIKDNLNINHIIPFCLNVQKADMNLISNRSVINVLNFMNNITVSEVYKIEGYDKQEKYIGSYNFNNQFRMPVEMNKLLNMLNMNYKNNPDVNVVVNKSAKHVLGKILGSFNYDFENKNNNEIILSDVVNGTTYKLYGTLQDEFVVMNDEKNNISFGMMNIISHHDHPPKTKCCDCIISPKDKRLQNQLHIKLGLVIDDIPLLFNKQQ